MHELLFAAAVTAAAPHVPPRLAALHSALEEYDRAQVAGDRRALERLLAADYLLVNGGAQTETKTELIADFTDPLFKLKPYKVINPSLRFWGDAAIAAGEVRLEGTSSGKAFLAHTRFADIWRWKDGRWQVEFTQVTRFPPEK